MFGKKKKEEVSMQIKRIVKINSFGVGGGSLTVTFKGLAYHQPGVTNSPSPSLNVEWSSMTGSNTELIISSPYFPTAKEASDWIDRLTDEIKKYIGITKESQDEFAALEGESII